MGARESGAMIEARKLVLGGVTAAEAARKTGITKSAIYMAQWYKDFKNVKVPCTTPE